MGQNNIAATSAFGALFGGAGGSASASTASGGAFGDAGEETPNTNAVPGPIFRFTTQTKYTLSDVSLLPSEQSGAQFFSIGIGTPPTAPFTIETVNENTGPMVNASVNGKVIPIPKIPGVGNAYLLELNIFNLDLVTDGDLSAPLAQTFFPRTPIGGVTPLEDEAASFDKQLTFAFGEFRFEGAAHPTISIRQSHDDRDDNGNPNPALDPNQDFVDHTLVGGDDFDNALTQGFFNPGDTIKLPAATVGGKLPTRRIRDLGMLRKAAVTTLMANGLYDFSRRTGQTRFVIDGRIIDISGFKK
ncbi:MAG: hypothetical protein IH991_00440 [Planctomycetes bacterium]|nr:hypothetical protein [Planctomycetota bacterium]